MQLIEYGRPALCFIAGVVFVWVMYGKSLKEYWANDDEHGANVTALAMFGSFLPFMGFAMITSMSIGEAARLECQAINQKAEDEWFDQVLQSDKLPPSPKKIDCFAS